MESLAIAADQVKEMARRLFAAQPIESHPLMVALSEGRLSLEQARALGIQIFHVVDHFPRLLAGLLANLPDWQRRTPVVENLWEEHGRGKPHRVHVATYRRFLASIGVSDAALEGSRPSIPVIAYNRALLDLCLHHHYAEGLGALSIVEEIVSRVSPLVAGYAIQHHGVLRQEIVHFSDHEVLDERHSDEFYELAATEMGGAHGALIEQGMSLGYYYHTRLYTDLLSEIQR